MIKWRFIWVGREVAWRFGGCGLGGALRGGEMSDGDAGDL